MIIPKMVGNEQRQIAVDFHHKKSRAKFALLIHIMAKCFIKQSSNATVTIRDLYYENPQLYKNQKRMSDYLLEICRSFMITRSDLGLEATAKGLIAGDLKWVYKNGREANVAGFPHGMLIPPNVKEIKEFITVARCIILVEKDAIFQRLLDEQIFNVVGSVILITGKGYPDLSTRSLLTKLSFNLHLPVFALVDSDPHGIEIATIVKWGAKSIAQLVDKNDYRVPDLIWIGLLPSEINNLALSTESRIPLTDNDKRKLANLDARPGLDKTWRNELQILGAIGVKLELEALTALGGRYLTSVYLRQKLNTYLDLKNVQV